MFLDLNATLGNPSNEKIIFDENIGNNRKYDSNNFEKILLKEFPDIKKICYFCPGYNMICYLPSEKVKLKYSFRPDCDAADYYSTPKIEFDKARIVLYGASMDQINKVEKKILEIFSK